MKEIQLGMFGDVLIYNQDNPTSPTPPIGFTPEPDETTLTGIKSSRLHKNTEKRCEKCTTQYRRADWFVQTRFNDRTSLIMVLCDDCNERYLECFAPFSNTGTKNKSEVTK